MVKIVERSNEVKLNFFIGFLYEFKILIILIMSYVEFLIENEKIKGIVFIDEVKLIYKNFDRLL